MSTTKVSTSLQNIMIWTENTPSRRAMNKMYVEHIENGLPQSQKRTVEGWELGFDVLF